MSLQAPEFKLELEQLVNRHSVDSELGIADFAIARLVVEFLDTLGSAMRAHDDFCAGHRSSISRPEQQDVQAIEQVEVSGYVTTDSPPCPKCGTIMCKFNSPPEWGPGPWFYCAVDETHGNQGLAHIHWPPDASGDGHRSGGGG